MWGLYERQKIVFPTRWLLDYFPYVKGSESKNVRWSKSTVSLCFLNNHVRRTTSYVTCPRIRTFYDWKGMQRSLWKSWSNCSLFNRETFWHSLKEWGEVRPRIDVGKIYVLKRGFKWVMYVTYGIRIPSSWIKNTHYSRRSSRITLFVRLFFETGKIFYVIVSRFSCSCRVHVHLQLWTKKFKMVLFTSIVIVRRINGC